MSATQTDTLQDLNRLSQLWLSEQPECGECGDIADLRWAVDWDSQCEYCSEHCAQSAYIREHTEEVLV